VVSEPRLRRVPDPAYLLGVHHLERVAETGARLALDLAEDDRAPAPGDDVDLVPTGPGVRVEDPVGPKPVPVCRAPFGVVTRLRP
jgi:hypothetical protein